MAVRLIWNIEEMTGYKPKTTFWEDFNIADSFSAAAIQDTYNRAFSEWKTNAVYITELAMVLNHRIWYWYDVNVKALKMQTLDTRADKYSKLYDKLWKQLDAWCLDNLKGKDLEYYIQTTDQIILAASRFT